MKNKEQLLQTALTVMMGLASAGTLAASSHAVAAEAPEPCYGIVKAGFNDCPTATTSCAGSATKDRQPDAFILLPKGTCQKIAGGSLVPIKDKQIK